MNEASQSPHNPPSLNLSLAGAFWVCGIMFSYFPQYASISAPWSWIFVLFAYVCFLFSIVGAFFSLAAVKKSKFLEYAGTGAFFGIIGFLLHTWAEKQGSPSWLILTLKLLVLASGILGVTFIATGIPHLVEPRKSVSATQLTATDVSAPLIFSKQPRFEKIISVIIALLSLLTALVPLLKAWLQIP